MNNYAVYEKDWEGNEYEEDFGNDITEAISFYKELCTTSTLSKNQTIELRKNGEAINRATFQDLEEDE